MGVNTNAFSGSHRLFVDGSAVGEAVYAKPVTEWDNGSDDHSLGLKYIVLNGEFAPRLSWSSSSDQPLRFKNEDTGMVPLTLSTDGKVGVNTNNFVGDYSLYIKGSSIAEEMFVKLEGQWGDFVFYDDYDLMPLQELRTFIDKEGRLPNMPTADEVKKDGIKTGATLRELTIKVEELTLYILEQQEEIEALKGND